MTSSSNIIVALDFETEATTEQFLDNLTPELCKLKVGKELFTQTGPRFVRNLVDRGYDVFLDLKFHDIPNTVAKAVAVAADMGVWMTDVHASGGSKMMTAAKQQLIHQQSKMLLIAVTVLTSMDSEDLKEVGINESPENQVLKLALLSQQSGLDGVVSSAREAAVLRQTMGEDFCLVTPGIRPVDASEDDQKRTVTPEDAIKMGSSYLVIGRPITRAVDPKAALLAIRNGLVNNCPVARSRHI